MAGTFDDVRSACQLAQSRIMNLQQATSNQVGLTSSVREHWFEELRSVAQCFITAQQASAKLEQFVNTERAQLQGALSAALNERDVMQAQRDAADQEIKFLRHKVDELLAKLKSYGENCDNWLTSGPSASFSSPTAKTTKEATPDGDTIDLLHQLPATVEDMPYTPEKTKFPPQFFGSGGLGSGNASGSRTAVGTSPALSTDKTRLGDGLSRFFAANGSPGLSPGHSQYSGNTRAQGKNQSQNNRFVSALTNPKSPIPSPTLHRPVTNELSWRRPNGSPGYPPSSSANRYPPVSGPMQRLQRGSHSQRSSSARPTSGRPGFGPPPPQQLSSAAPPFVPQQRRTSMQPTSAGLPPATGTDVVLVRRDDNMTNLAKDFSPAVNHPIGSTDESRVRDVFEFFNSTREWVMKYCGAANIDAVHDMQARFPREWEYACSAAYPGNRRHAAGHAMYMLGNHVYRSYFLSRLLIQYVTQHLWQPHAWVGMDNALSETIQTATRRLDLRWGYDPVLQPHERHALVDKRCRAIHDFMTWPNWSTYREQKISQSTVRFRDICGTMLVLNNTNQYVANAELRLLCESAWRISAMLNTSRLTFDFIFNDCGLKFVEGSHYALNTDVPPRTLQLHQWRLMCVATPGITCRDVGSNLQPRFLAKANVLVMQ